MSNTRLSKETLPLMPIPRISPELLAFLDQNFPERCAELGDDLPTIYHKAGQRYVVKFLMSLFEEQNENV
jgi:hypothetical protein